VPRMSFQTKALLGYFLLALILAAGMSLSVRRFSSAVDEQVALLRAAEHEITLVERLRWRSEVIVSDGRGYLLSGDPTLLGKLEYSVVEFDANVQALSRRAHPLVDEADDAARNFRRVQRDLVTARQRPEGTPSLIGRFETELLPLRHELDQALARLVDHRQAALDDFYEASKRSRGRLELWLSVLRGVLVLAGLAVAWYFAKLLTHSYRQELDAKEAAGKALAARDEVMGVVAHDLRNPLGAITLKAALLQEETDLEKVRQQAASIGNVALRMEYLIKGLLDVTTMEAGKFTVHPTPCAVHDLLREIEAMFDPLAAAKQIGLQRAEGETGLVVRAERERVLQVLSNLVGNALKFTPRGGHVTLSVERHGAMARFAVLDTGPGISRESLAHIFDRFWKKETPGAKGTGLGLFIARGIVEAHGGQIWVNSDLGHGATFYFTLPLVEPHTKAERRPDTAIGPASPEAGPA
jgi:signal transduction histidine kinase